MFNREFNEFNEFKLSIIFREPKSLSTTCGSSMEAEMRSSVFVAQQTASEQFSVNSMIRET